MKKLLKYIFIFIILVWFYQTTNAFDFDTNYSINCSWNNVIIQKNATTIYTIAGVWWWCNFYVVKNWNDYIVEWVDYYYNNWYNSQFFWIIFNDNELIGSYFPWFLQWLYTKNYELVNQNIYYWEDNNTNYCDVTDVNNYYNCRVNNPQNYYVTDFIFSQNALDIQNWSYFIEYENFLYYTYDDKFPFVNICNFTNLDNPALTVCHNFDTNLTWSLIINVYDSWSWVLTWSWDIQALRRENKIWFDSSFNLREEIGDNLLFSFFSQSGSYNWEVIVEYNNWNNSEIVQTFIIQSQWYEWYVIGVNPLPTKTIDTSQCKLDVDNDDDVEFLNWEFFIWFYNCFVYSIDTINSGFESVFKLTNTVKNIWNTNEEKSLFNFLFWIKSANASDFTNAFNERDETTLFYKIPHFIIWWFYTFLIITWLWFLISLKNK